MNSIEREVEHWRQVQFVIVLGLQGTVREDAIEIPLLEKQNGQNRNSTGNLALYEVRNHFLSFLAKIIKKLRSQIRE